MIFREMSALNVSYFLFIESFTILLYVADIESLKKYKQKNNLLAHEHTYE